MENSRKPALIDAVSLALAQWSAAQATQFPAPHYAVAFSGGRDSTVLLHALVQQLDVSQCVALHVHHGLQPDADAWQQHCQAICQQLGVPLHIRHIQVSPASGLGLEAAARHARYAALVEMAQQAQCAVVLTAHHADDQVESVLLQLLRGTGVMGAAGMPVSKPLGRSPSTQAQLSQQRPLLGVSAADIRAYASRYQLTWVEDPSNQNTHYARNALRHNILPQVEQHFPDYRNTLARFARHAAQAQDLLEALAQEDYRHCQQATDALSTKQLLKFSAARQANLLRYWLAGHQLCMPDEARLHELLRRLRENKTARAWSLVHDRHEIRFEYDVLHVRALSQQWVAAQPFKPLESIAFRWQGESEIAMPAWAGCWKFIPAAQGVEVAWLQQQPLLTCARQPGWRLKLHPQRPSRSLKNLYQEARIPQDQRARLPILRAHQQILAAAGLGMDCRLIAAPQQHQEPQNYVQIVWSNTCTSR